ncbi:thioredoxin domain-containing protein [Orbaceae bacterium ac157xtp]
MFKKILITMVTVLLSTQAIADEVATTDEPTKIEEGVQYVSLPKFASPEKEVVEFFSFSCPSCYRFETEYKGTQFIEANLPENVKLKRYVLNNYGPLAQEFAQAWAIANVLGISQDVAEKLYQANQQDKTIKTADDIKGIFINLGVEESKFEEMKNNFLVQAFIAQQNQAQQELKPATIPSFYVNSKYLIIPQGLKPENNSIIADYSRVINYLTDLK